MASSKHEKQLARMRAERQAARRAAEAARRKRRRAVLASTVAVLGVVAVTVVLALKLRHTDKTTAADATAPTPSPSAAAPVTVNGCTYTPTGEPAKPATPPTAADVVKAGAAAVTLTLNQGKVALKLDNAKAPCTVGSFRSLARQKYFDGTPCHRLTTSGIFVLQCGDPSGMGSGGPGYAFADENLTGATYPKGTVAMANSGVGTNGSQFFLVYKDTKLPASYSPFGTITAGLDVLDKIAAGGSQPADDGKPKLPVTITTATVAPAA